MVLLALFLLLPLHGVRAADLPVDLELVLAVDVSHSMDVEEQLLQRDGYVAAFRHPEVLEAIAGGRHRRISVTYVEWAGLEDQTVQVPWTLIDGAQAAERFADALAAAPFRAGSRTSISSALGFSTRLFEGNGYQGLRRVIDVSGDGPNNMGAPIEGVRDAVVARGIVVNGLPLMLRPAYLAGFADAVELNDYYRDCVIGGLGSFLITVEKREEIAEAIRRKLILELAGPPPLLIRASQSAERPKVDCLIGEKLHQDVP